MSRASAACCWEALAGPHSCSQSLCLRAEPWLWSKLLGASVSSFLYRVYLLGSLTARTGEECREHSTNKRQAATDPIKPWTKAPTIMPERTWPGACVACKT